MEQTKLKSILKKKGITPYRLAKECSITPPDMYSSINGKKPMFPRWKKSIAEYLGMYEEDIFEE